MQKLSEAQRLADEIHEKVFDYVAAREDCVRPNHSDYDMPRWASRITLEITDVRVERLAEPMLEAKAAIAKATEVAT